ncbi:MAG: hypothetical protein JSW11_02450 [Candidatus Heimdallarchaeota archaeon]|nr:MAG: hypothetical protein JSW11_02450 [Candidatus Heimdallarchaeota archaeon]
MNFLPDHEDSKYWFDIVVHGRTFTLIEILSLKEYDVIERILILSVFGGFLLVLITFSFVLAVTINNIMLKKTQRQSNYNKYRFSRFFFFGFFFIQLACLFNLIFQPLKIQMFSVGEIQIHKSIFPLMISFFLSGLFLLLYGTLHYKSVFVVVNVDGSNKS